MSFYHSAQFCGKADSVTVEVHTVCMSGNHFIFLDTEVAAQSVTLCCWCFNILFQNH